MMKKRRTTIYKRDTTIHQTVLLALEPHPGDDDEPLSQNGYSYANGNPVMDVDPNGKWAFLIRLVPTAGKWVVKNGKKLW